MRLFRRIAPPSLVTLGLGCAGALLFAPAAMAEGMPQLDFHNPLTISQVVWGAIIFVVLYILLSKFALPQVSSVLDERASHINADLESARQASQRAEAGKAEAAEATAKARSEAQASVNAALDEAKAAAAAQTAALNNRLEKQLSDAEGQINAARAAAMNALRQVATETADTVVTRLTGAAPDGQRLNNAIGAALSARGLG
jgi:F-type H+-transporting ATPase subunit b